MSSETTQSVGIYEFLAWLETNKRPLIIATVAVVVLVSAVSIYRWKAARRRKPRASRCSN